MQDQTWPSESLVTITKSDSTTYQPPLRQIYVGTGGDLAVTDVSGASIIFKNVSDGQTIGPFYATKVNATGTTASNLVGFK